MAIVASILLLALGVLLQAFSAFADAKWLSSTLPLFSLLFGLLGAISMFGISEKGFSYVGGWTFCHTFRTEISFHEIT